jgi:hypothetical protein
MRIGTTKRDVLPIVHLLLGSVIAIDVLLPSLQEIIAVRNPSRIHRLLIQQYRRSFHDFDVLQCSLAALERHLLERLEWQPRGLMADCI